MNSGKQTAVVPMQHVGPVKITGPELDALVEVPLATFETPLWPSTNRGARVSRLAGGIHAVVVNDCMTRSILVQAPNAMYANEVAGGLERHGDALSDVVAQTSRFARLKDWHVQQVGDLLYIRFSMKTGDAAGHNMVTKAADALLEWILLQYGLLEYVSISGNFCVDKKVSAVNGILGRGKSVIAEVVISGSLCREQLRTTPEKIVDLNIKKNLIGTMLAGGLRSANAHFANLLFAFYLATGQDVANIVEGSQGIVHAEVRGEDLYFSVSLPNIIVGTIGNGKELPFVRENLRQLGCLEKRKSGQNARRLALIIGATVLCGELSLLAAQTNQGELMKSHLKLEREGSSSNV